MSSNFLFDRKMIRENPDAILKFIEELSSELENFRTEFTELNTKLSEQDAKLSEQDSKISEQDTRISDLESENVALKAQLAKYTSPHIPSSKQLYPKKKIGKQSGMPKQPRGKRGGSKKGKSGATWDQKDPDEVINNYVKKCLNCHQLADESDQSISYSKIILEIPEVIPVSLQQHHIYKYQCNCGKTTQAAAPTLEGTFLGPNFLTFLTTARYRTGGSFENLSKLIEDNSGVKPSQTALNRGLSKVSDLLEPVADKIASEVMNSDWLNIDETGHKLVLEGKKSQTGSKKIWVWVFGRPDGAYYHIAMHRDSAAIKSALQYRADEKPPPISVSDAYPAYLNSFDIKQFCWAHLLRDSKEEEDHCLSGKILHDRLVDLFQRLKALQKSLREKGKNVSDKVYKRALHDITELAEAKSDCEAVRKVQKHLRFRGEHYLTCLKNSEVPMTNNHAERLLKSVIIHRSNGKPLRSEKAMKEYGTLLTVLTTWKLRGLVLGDTLRELIVKETKDARLV